MDETKDNAVVENDQAENIPVQEETVTDSGKFVDENAFILTNENYYSEEADKHYMSNSRFKAVYGHPAHPSPCQAMAIYGPKPKSEALIVGSYVDSYFEGPDSFKEFKETHENDIMQKTGKKPYKFITDADLAIARVEKDPVFMHYLGGSHQTIMTGEIAGTPFKIKMDAYHKDEMIVDLKYVKGIGGDWNPILRKHTTFIEEYGYFIQGAIYQEIVRQNTGKKLPFYIAYITKEDIPDFDVIQLPQDKLDEALEFVKVHLTSNPYQDILKAPVECGKRSCPYCRDRKKLIGPKQYADLEAALLEV